VLDEASILDAKQVGRFERNTVAGRCSAPESAGVRSFPLDESDDALAVEMKSVQTSFVVAETPDLRLTVYTPVNAASQTIVRRLISAFKARNRK
jgi:hypothetical protein